MLFLIVKTYVIIIFIFSIRAVVPRAKIDELIDFFWKNLVLTILVFLFYIFIILVFYII